MIDIGDANRLWEQLGPRVTIPMHFKNERCPFPTYGVERFLQEKPSINHVDQTECELAPATLPEYPAVFVLNPAR